MPKSGLNVALKGLDDIFSTEESRQEEQREQVQQIPVSELFPFKNHPFKVLDDDSMTRTVESISQFGVLAPLIARPRPEGGYEIVSGHRRKHAAELANLDTVPVIVRNMEDDAATILMVDSNLQREHMQKIEVVVRITKDHCPPQEQTIFEWFDLMRNPTDALSRPDLEINLEHHRVFKHGTEVYMSRYEYGVLSLMAQHPGKLFTKEQIFEAVWHKDSESYLRAVTSTIGRIRQKIEDDKDHPRYIKTVSNIGYQFVPSSESVRLNRNL